MTTDDTENGWDSILEGFGIESEKHEPKSEPPAPKPAARPIQRPVLAARPEPDDEPDDFGSGVEATQLAPRAALFDPGPETVAEDDFDDSAPEPMDDVEDDAEPIGGDVGEAGESSDTGEGGKKRRRRRRRKKKGGTTDAVEPGHLAAGEEDDESIVEEGEAPGEVEDDDDDEELAPAAVDEELDADVALPRPEWHVMTWNELVSKLYRPT